MCPVSGVSRRHEMAVSVMPDTYSQGVEKRSSLEILCRQMAAVRKVVSELGHDLPMYGAGHLIRRFVPNGGEHESRSLEPREYEG